MNVQSTAGIKGVKEIRSNNSNGSDDNIFKSVLEREKSKIDEIEKKENEKKYEESNNIKHFGEILHLNMNNRENFTKDNGKLNLMDILKQYGNDIDTKGLNKLVGVLNALHKEGLLDDDDYFEGLKWINNKIFEKAMKINIDKEKFKVIESLDKE